MDGQTNDLNSSNQFWFWLAFLYTPIATITFGVTKGAAEMTVAAASGGLLMAFASLDKLKKFKALGFEAEMREIIKEARASLRQLQRLASVTASTLFSTVQMTGRIGGFPDEQKEEVKDQVLQILSELQVPSDEQEQALSYWHACVEFDYAHNILGGNNVPDSALAIKRESWNDRRGKGIAGRATPQQIREFLEEHGLLTPNQSDRLADYEFYCRERRHRRPEEWAKRAEWRLHK